MLSSRYGASRYLYTCNAPSREVRGERNCEESTAAVSVNEMCKLSALCSTVLGRAKYCVSYIADKAFQNRVVVLEKVVGEILKNTFTDMFSDNFVMRGNAYMGLCVFFRNRSRHGP